MYDIQLGWRIRKVGEKQYLVGSNRAIELSGSAPYFIEMMMDGLPHDRIVSTAAEDFGIDPEKIDNDFRSLIQFLKTAEILE